MPARPFFFAGGIRRHTTYSDFWPSHAQNACNTRLYDSFLAVRLDRPVDPLPTQFTGRIPNAPRSVNIRSVDAEFFLLDDASDGRTIALLKAGV
jgi:hypothetical protein